MLRTDFPDYQSYYIEEADLGNYKGKVNQELSTIELRKSGRLNISKFIGCFADKWQEKIRDEIVDYNAIQFKGNHIQYKDIEAERIIFCEGYRAKFNPYFSDLNYEEAKGERLIVKIPNAHFKKILKHKLYIVPIEDDLYWIGATNQWDHLNDLPTVDNLNILKNKLNSILKVPYEIIDHQAAIRPTNKDRRPLLGLHPFYKRVGIFNALGSKGSSVGPYFANEMVNHLLHNKPLNKEVDIQRIYDKEK